MQALCQCGAAAVVARKQQNGSLPDVGAVRCCQLLITKNRWNLLQLLQMLVSMEPLEELLENWELRVYRLGTAASILQCLDELRNTWGERTGVYVSGWWENSL
jgi:hypothetical protein